ncbi:hypothetical protein Barb7_02626 [Bacteroidales bacterium Barb7]|nr:hypothetical protein Barb7_02626 [Bacteroidales bacterium Barb7]
MHHIHDINETLLSPSLAKKSEQKTDCLVNGQDMQFTGIFNVHNLVANIIGSLHQINQRVADKLPCLIRTAGNTEFFRNFQVGFFFGLKESKLFLPAFSKHGRWKRVFDNRSKGAVRQSQSPLPPSDKLMGKQAQGVGISFKVEEILPSSAFLAYRFFQPFTFPVLEIGGNSPFSGMPERRIAHIMRQTGSGNDETYIGKVGILTRVFRV